MRVLGKGKTALAIASIVENCKLYDDQDYKNFDPTSDEPTVISPGIAPHNHLVLKTKYQMSDYDLFLTKNHFTIWISGTNGKTTTTSMLYHLLQEDHFLCGGNIGTPLAEIYDKSSKLILETSSFTLHYTNKVYPNIYVLLPISSDHIYWHGSFEEYEKSKLKPLYMMDQDCIAIIPEKYRSVKTKAKVYFYKDTQGLAKQFDIPLEKINFKEPFLQDGVLALSVQKMVKNIINIGKLNCFVQDPHKLEEFYDTQNRLWCDDSKATNVDATIQALKNYKDKTIYLIIGGDDKGVELEDLFIELKKYKIELFTIGSNTNKLENLSQKYKIKSYKCETLEVAVRKIDGVYGAKEGVALLSPAAASLDQFSSYKDRGEKFKQFVKNI